MGAGVGGIDDANVGPETPLPLQVELQGGWLRHLLNELTGRRTVGSEADGEPAVRRLQRDWGRLGKGRRCER